VSSAFTINSAVTTITLCANDNSCGAAGGTRVCGFCCVFSCFGLKVPLIVSGFGQTISDSSDSTSTTLNYASLRSVSASACALKFATNFGCSNCLPATNVCAESDVLSDPSKDSCFGDSGGPLVQNFNQASPVWRLYGVVSSGTVPAGQTPSCGKPGE
jgi:secreted trypsin-like serine protease